MHVTVLGFPLAVGGANSECGHTVLLWRRAGIKVTIIPTWHLDDDAPWTRRLLDAGCRIIETNADNLHAVPGLAGGIVSGWCNYHVCDAWDELQRLGCKVVWSPCMTTQPFERRTFRRKQPAALHLESEYQRSQLGAWYAERGLPADRQFLIRGAFELADFPYAPKPHDGKAFYIGRLARPDRLKWNRSMFATVASVRERKIEAEMLLMGWNHEVEAKCGVAPPWAKCFAPGSMTSQDFLANCHVLLCMNGGNAENWPRIGLEAMASGVPIVAEKQWGWPEMLEHRVTGLLYDTPSEAANFHAELANDETYRLELAENARQAVQRLTSPDRIIRQWMELFHILENEK